MKTLLIILIHFAWLTPQLVFGQNQDSVSQEDKRAYGSVKNCEQNKYEKYSGAIEIAKTPKYVYYELDSIRIYISPFFIAGFLSRDVSTTMKIYEKFQEDYGQLFEQGFVTGKMFICERVKDCKFPIQYVKKGRKLIPYKNNEKLFGYEGTTIKILNIEERYNFNKKTKRIFEIWTTFSKTESGWSAFDVYYVELTNEKVENDIDLNEFLKGARLTCFKYGGTQI